MKLRDEPQQYANQKLHKHLHPLVLTKGKMMLTSCGPIRAEESGPFFSHHPSAVHEFHDLNACVVYHLHNWKPPSLKNQLLYDSAQLEVICPNLT